MPTLVTASPTMEIAAADIFESEISIFFITTFVIKVTFSYFVASFVTPLQIRATGKRRYVFGRLT